MLNKIYEKIILKKPILVLFFTILAVLVLAFNALKLEVDASADTLLLENDKDLKYSRIINKRYQNQDYLAIAYTVKDDLLSKNNIETIKKLAKDLEELSLVTGTLSIVNAPLLTSSKKELADLTEDMLTLLNSNIDKKLIKEEFLTSPLYKNALVSADFQTTLILAKLKTNEKYFKLIEKKEKLEKIENPNNEQKKELEDILVEYKKNKEIQREIEHQTIADVRAILKKYENEADLFLGGVTMIADDIIAYIKNDLFIYGVALLSILVIVLWIIFGELKWIFISIFICTLSVIATTGILGLFGWQVTVISSNFISLQLIITLSIVLHLIVRYKELCHEKENAEQKELVCQTVLSKIKPSFFAIITTIAGFSSLVVSNIKPVVNLGLMMSLGIAISLFISFLIFPSLLMLFKKSKSDSLESHIFSITKLCSNTVLNHGNKIIIVTVLISIFSIWASSKLIVENSFINYFKSSTPIYKGMEVIDQKLGGTTPLDIIIDFKEEEKQNNKQEKDEFLSEFDDEFSQSGNEPKYWFTPQKMEIIKKVHAYLDSLDEIGDVQSFATLLSVGKSLNNDKELDSLLLGLMYTQLPNEYKKLILLPYINIENNQARFSTRIIDSNKDLRRDELLKKIERDLEELLKNDKVEVHQAGLMVLYNNMLQSLFNSQILTLGFVLLIIFVMFVVLFKSLKVALIALVVNIVPVSIVFGIMGFFGIPLDIMTITIAAITIGIGVDDTIHYIHRFRVEYSSCGDYVLAMKKSHQSIGYAMYYTSLTIILGFGILVFSNFLPTIYFGLLTVLVMFVVLLADLLLLPKLLIALKPFGK